MKSRVLTSIGSLLLAGLAGLLIADTLPRINAPSGLDRSTDVLLLVAIVTACIGPLIWQGRKGRFDLFAPTTIVALAFLLGYVMPAVTVMRGTDTTWLRWGASITADTDALLREALVSTLVAIVAFQIGFAVYPRRLAGSLPIPTDDWQVRPLQSASVILFGVGALAVAYLTYAVGGPQNLIGGFSNRIRFLAGLNYFVLLAQFGVIAMTLWIAYRLKQGDSIVKASGYILIGLLFALVSGAKATLIAYALIVLILLHYLRKRIGIIRAAVFAAIGIPLYVGYNLFFREYVVRGYVVLDPTGQDRGFVEAIWYRFSGNTFIQFQSLMIAHNYWPSREAFEWGSTYLLLVTAPIPRSLYPDKPISPAGLFSEVAFPDLWARGTSIPPSFVGEAYINGGNLGIAIVMALFGMFYGIAYGYLRRAPGNPGVVLLYGVTVGMMFHWLRGESYAPMILWLMQMVPLVFALRTMSLYARRQERRTPQPVIRTPLVRPGRVRETRAW